jgi:HTH-type transcriptional regulator, sugar sensing transcriptional regulator
MTQKNINEILQQLGLTETEARVYLAMLELGPSSVQNIAKKARISRTAAYDIIRALQEKGISSTFQKGRKNVFSVEDPKQLEDYFGKHLDQMKEHLGAFKHLLPELRLMQGDDKPKVRYYSGDEGIQALFRDLHASRARELFEYVDADLLYEHVDEKRFLSVRERYSFNGIAAKALSRGKIKNPRKEVQYRQMKSHVRHFSGQIWIYSDRIAFTKFVGDIEVVIIENKVFAETLRAVMQIAWEASDPVRISATE